MTAPNRVKSQESASNAAGARVKKKAAGFTLIEIMIAIVIIAVLATIGLVTYSSAQRSARISKRLQDIQAIQSALELYRSANGGYPSNAGGNGGSVSCANSATALGLLAPTYMPTVPNDPSYISGGTINCYYYHTSATSGTSTDYKLRTNLSSTTEMTQTVTGDYSQQPNYIDPNRDFDTSTAAKQCSIETSGPGSAITAWAVYTTGGCAY